MIHIFTVGDPNAFFEFDLFSGRSRSLSASQSSVTGGVWDELVANHLIPDTFGAHQADTVAAVTDIQTKVLELKR